MKTKTDIHVILTLIAIQMGVFGFSTITKASESGEYCNDLKLFALKKFVERANTVEIDCKIHENLDCNGGTLLIYATRKGYTDTVELLISKGANVNAKDLNGNTALRYALFFNFPKIAELLIANGAINDDSNWYGYRAISMCSREHAH